MYHIFSAYGQTQFRAGEDRHPLERNGATTEFGTSVKGGVGCLHQNGDPSRIDLGTHLFESDREHAGAAPQAEQRLAAYDEQGGYMSREAIRGPHLAAGGM